MFSSVDDIVPFSQTKTHLEREQIHLLLLEQVARGLADVSAGRTTDARQALDAMIQQRKERSQ